jgi:hypothetical protein
MDICIFALLIRQAQRMSHYFIDISGRSGSTVLHTLYHKFHHFRENIIKHKMGVLIFATTFFQHISQLKWETIIKVHTFSRKVPVNLMRLWRNLTFLDIFGKYSYINFHENPRIERIIIHCGQMDRLDALGRWIACNNKVRGRNVTGHWGPEGGVQVQLYSCLTSALDGGVRSIPRPSHFTPRKETRNPLFRDFVRLRADLVRCKAEKSFFPCTRSNPETSRL